MPSTWCNGRAMADEPNKKSGGIHDLVKAESMIQLALAIPAGCLIGWAVGAWLDRHFHQEWIAVTGIVLGAVGGFLQIYRTASRFLKDDR
jgi:ATP synthase protein I